MADGSEVSYVGYEFEGTSAGGATPNKSPILSIRGVYKSFKGESVLNNIDLDVCSGEFITIIGPSGCGKTTLLRLIAGLEVPDSGNIYIYGKDVTKERAEFRPVHTIFQDYALFPHMTVYDNISFALKMKNTALEELRNRVDAIIESVQLRGLEHKYPRHLSGGQQQRVAIARAIINRPAILLLDECLSALDYNLRRRMQNELKSFQRELGIPFLFVTHDQEEALSLSDRLILLKNGMIEQQGTPRALYEDPLNTFVAKFIGDSNIFEAVVLDCLAPDTLLAKIEGKTLSISASQYLLSSGITQLESLAGRRLYVLLRPEDLRIEELEEGEETDLLTGIILERNYKGATLESTIKLDSGKHIIASEFFNEEEPDVNHPLHQRVSITWVNNWEVILDE